ncbi:ABC transporter permease [Antribacter gilvus]|uniref:ABC transporter permease n=1 Tax=Antribacter gilvus TaxID=2304675 RepID=UPI001F0BB4B0|nr:ABC transporter permease [Antribacter gilvus]
MAQAGMLSSPRGAAVRAGLSRGWIETRQSLTNVGDLIWYVMFPLIYAGVLFMMRGSTVPGTDFALGAMVLPSIVGMSIAFGGLVGPSSVLAVEREDGTLLRAKATPNGMLGYLVGKIVNIALTTAFSLVVLVIPGWGVRDQLRVDEPRAWLLIVAIFVLGLIATVPIGAALGSLLTSSAQTGLLMLGSSAMIAVSGIFYPITALPGWLQWVGQALPFYWLGLGARSALLPPEMVAAEIGESWRTVEMVGVLGVWAVAGLVLAPILLRRMAQRESGSDVAERREKVMTRGY